MKEERYFYVPDAAVKSELPEEEAIHAVRVLRMQPGDQMVLMDGMGTFYQAEVSLATGHRCQYNILETLVQEPSWPGHLHLAMAPTKLMDRVEWFVEKATEIGVDEFSMLDCQFSERKVIKTPRLEKIIVSAMKQSRKPWKPVVHKMVSFRSFISSHQSGQRFIAHCYDEVPRLNLFNELCHLPMEEDITVLIGPEGDFSIDEVRFALSEGFVSVDLGKSRLRTETAALSAVMMMQLSKQMQHDK